MSEESQPDTSWVGQIIRYLNDKNWLETYICGRTGTMRGICRNIFRSQNTIMSPSFTKATVEMIQNYFILKSDIKNE